MVSPGKYGRGWSNGKYTEDTSRTVRLLLLMEQQSVCPVIQQNDPWLKAGSCLVIRQKIPHNAQSINQQMAVNPNNYQRQVNAPPF